jgi:hypothetical protein
MNTTYRRSDGEDIYIESGKRIFIVPKSSIYERGGLIDNIEVGISLVEEQWDTKGSLLCYRVVLVDECEDCGGSGWFYDLPSSFPTSACDACYRTGIKLTDSDVAWIKAI